MIGLLKGIGICDKLNAFPGGDPEMMPAIRADEAVLFQIGEKTHLFAGRAGAAKFIRHQRRLGSARLLTFEIDIWI